MQPVNLGDLNHYQCNRLHFIESRQDIGVIQAVPMIKQTINYLAEKCSGKALEFWDCPPGTSCSVMAAAYNADFVILVSEPTPFGLYDLGLAVDTMEQIGKPVAVVINRFGIGNDEILKFCARKKIPIWATIPNLRAIAELYAEGEIIYPVVAEFRTALDFILQQIRTMKKDLCGK